MPPPTEFSTNGPRPHVYFSSFAFCVYGLLEDLKDPKDPKDPKDIKDTKDIIDIKQLKHQQDLNDPKHPKNPADPALWQNHNLPLCQIGT